MVPAPVLAELSRAALEALTRRLLAENDALHQALADLQQTVSDLKQTVAAQAEEIARLKGLKGPPKFTPSGMEPKAPPTAEPRAGAGRTGGKRDRLVIAEDRIVAAQVPAGARFKGYADFLIQELVLGARVIRYRRERWQLPDGTFVTAAMPDEVTGHFGPELRRFILFQHVRCQVTVERLQAHLTSVGIIISKRQVIRLLNAGEPDFVADAQAVLTAGLSTAR